ncbi:hypothetical protein BZL30_4866 [Mycobacterium kansasii]|uniref:Uncharacterized protein n=1 Tax=Mycobacterium kansasii TaxID=1768 RepID=A0A1V3X4R1_MYCKA|nr:hypothetical protein BZL30_4866 [Mycobacterium kansasii]
MRGDVDRALHDAAGAPAMSPRMMSPAFSTMSDAFSTALVAMSLAASTASLGLMAIGGSSFR